jgi:hypothetical protein
MNCFKDQACFLFFYFLDWALSLTIICNAHHLFSLQVLLGFSILVGASAWVDLLVRICTIVEISNSYFGPSLLELRKMLQNLAFTV